MEKLNTCIIFKFYEEKLILLLFKTKHKTEDISSNTTILDLGPFDAV